MGTIIVGLILIIVVLFIIKKMLKNKLAGKSISGCDGNCGHCNGSCHINTRSHVSAHGDTGIR